MSSHTFGDPHAGEAQWVLSVARDRMPTTIDLTQWYLYASLQAFDGRTPEQLVRQGEAMALVLHLQESKPGVGDPAA